MDSRYPVRNTVRVVLLNDKQELLLMHVDDPQTRSIGQKYRGSFWVTIGGQVEEQETVPSAAFREIFEETGIQKSEVRLGPVIWLRELDLVLYGKSVHIKEQYILANTNKLSVVPTQITRYEMQIIKSLQWFSLQNILNSREIIYPKMLKTLMPDVIAGKYPKSPLTII